MATFGNSVAGTGSAQRGANTTSSVLGTLTESGSVTQMSLYCKTETVNTNCKCAIYVDAAGSAGALKLQSGETVVSSTSIGWVNFTVNNIYLTAGTYWLSWWQQGTATMDYGWDPQAGAEVNKNLAYGAWPDPMGAADGTLNNKVNIYATYTPGTLLQTTLDLSSKMW